MLRNTLLYSSSLLPNESLSGHLPLARVRAGPERERGSRLKPRRWVHGECVEGGRELHHRNRAHLSGRAASRGRSLSVDLSRAGAH